MERPISESPRRLPIPMTMILVGNPMSGKTYFVKTLLLNRDRIFTRQPKHIYWFYGTEQSALFTELINANLPITFVAGHSYDNIARLKTIAAEEPGQYLCVFDDLQISIEKDREMTSLFASARHLGLSLIVILQGIFNRSKELVFWLDATNFIVLFKMGISGNRLQLINSRLFPSYKRFLIDAFALVSKRQQGFPYLVICNLSGCNILTQVFSNLFPTEGNSETGNLLLSYVPTSYLEELKRLEKHKTQF